MYHHQNGFFPSLVKALSRLIYFGIVIIGIYNIVSLWLNFQKEMPFKQALFQFVPIAGAIILFYFIFINPLLLVLGGLFPAIRITKQGLKYRYLLSNGGLIKWNEIEEVIDLKRPQKYKAVLFSQRGLSIFNELWACSIHGLLFLGVSEPLIIISPLTEDREQLLEEISKNLVTNHNLEKA
jgi:hypothetical protein